jgi:hypothetical protein
MTFLSIVLGLPTLLLIVTIVAGLIYRGRDADLIDWSPTRSPETEIKLRGGEVEQLLAAQNELRRRRGAPALSLEEATKLPRRA